MKDKNYGGNLKNTKDELALSFSFLIIGLYFVFIPKFFGNEFITRTVSIIVILIGILGLTIELNKIIEKHKIIGFDDFGVGLILVIITQLLHYYFLYIWLNVLFSFILLLGIFGLVRGLITIIGNMSINKPSIKNMLIKALIIISQIIAFIAALLQSMQILKIVK
ncbi:hypothetical protein CPAST_c25810 [Clostridium pasteurianum DSM 525 = ATCC 6013]|uniref:Uncharacterized protein n=1 Tax=Clostridium pasteurianum DSM 525 = ATCC 6013 TaxID=1262449 RepID=A0A0H3JAK7_CLOPA|nr:hypothetical protein [Clostridium pasteurianum]AJA48650.1 hypothetical protein CPAST_c25810 [Clostridium pasteurianum DSM 525 = ATCC 6013]AJA52638.1 hypothetical protein CLPA_c25810 [Clostridium pasteurianum DSM 525 = ATCC 6013]AOZ75879.1 hypothetical protein AQ983_12545 [Clostridium pasteurianum DSM 525 = ATCC 6013]AOZ79675.1 hypothetical protein AQ984_12540 [Clostridium pasteurianum]ELP59949.1 hypothetical protein F502_04917 [Clostridium pasteurianum DSM 525 = ATCC 6013]